jgi:hypothetical protein
LSDDFVIPQEAFGIINLATLLHDPCLFDRATLEPTFAYHTNDSLNCDKKILTLSKKVDFLTAKTTVRNAQKCFSLTEKPRASTEQFHFRCCTCRVLNPSFLVYMSMFNGYKKAGTLPFSGGSLEQPAVFFSLMQIIDTLVSEMEEREMKKAQKKK